MNVFGALWRRIRANWNTTDTLVLAGNLVAFGFFIGNLWWESPEVATWSSAAPLIAQALLRPRDKTLREALAFGAVVGWTWPLGEGCVVRLFGWWGSYVAPGPIIWDTPVYCVLIGQISATYLLYLARRTTQMGYSLRAAAGMAGISALGLGAIGENLFVGANMWVYAPSAHDWGAAPAFVPIAYGLSYATLPLLRRIPPAPAGLLFNAITLVFSVSLGLLVGFFPR